MRERAGGDTLLPVVIYSKIRVLDVITASNISLSRGISFLIANASVCRQRGRRASESCGGVVKE